MPEPWSFILKDPPARYVIPLCPPIKIFLVADPPPIEIEPDRLVPLPMFSVSADDVLLAMLIVDVASRLPDAMFITVLVAFPFKKLYVELLTSPLNAFSVELWTFPENTFVVEPLMSPEPRLSVAEVLAPVKMFTGVVSLIVPVNTFVNVLEPLIAPVKAFKFPPVLALVIIFTCGVPFEVLNVILPLTPMFMVPPPMVVVADELGFEFNVTLPERRLFAMINVADELVASIEFVTSVPFTLRFWLRETSPINVVGPLKMVAPLTSRAYWEDMSLLIAIELETPPSLTFPPILTPPEPVILFPIITLPVIEAFVPTKIFPDVTPVPMSMLPVVVFVNKLLETPAVAEEIVFAVNVWSTVKVCSTAKVCLTRIVPFTSKLCVGSLVFTPTFPKPFAANNEMRSLKPEVESFSMPIVSRPFSIVVPPTFSWYWMYA